MTESHGRPSRTGLDKLALSQSQAEGRWTDATDACSAVRRNVLEELGQLGKRTDEIDEKICDHVTSQGALAYELFVLEQGTADLVQGDDHIGTFGPGDLFGEIGLIQSGRRMASVIASSAMHLRVTATSELSTMEGHSPGVAEHARREAAGGHGAGPRHVTACRETMDCGLPRARPLAKRCSTQT